MSVEKRVLLIEQVRSRRERMAAIIENIVGFQLSAQVSDVEEAIMKATAASPQVVLLDAEQMGEADELVKRLAGEIPDAAIICTKGEWTETTALQVMRAGAKGYLAKQFTADEFRQAVAAAEEASGGIAGKIVTLFSPKAGCGKTTLAVNLALGLTQQSQARVGVVDANLSFGDAALFYNLYPKTTIVEATRDLQYLSPATLGAYLTSYGQSIRLLASASKPEKAELIRGRDIAALLAMMRSLFHYVVVDTEPGFTDSSLTVCDGADTVYIVAAFDGQAGEHVRRSLATFHSMGYQDTKLKVVVTRVPSRDIDCLKKLEEQIAYPVTALLPNDFRLIVDAVNKGAPLLSTHPTSAVAKGINDVARDIIGANILFSQQDEPRKMFRKLFGRG